MLDFIFAVAILVLGYYIVSMKYDIERLEIENEALKETVLVHSDCISDFTMELRKIVEENKDAD
jgi:cell division protein FtsL